MGVIEALAVGEVVPVDVADAITCSLEVKLRQAFLGLKDELEVPTCLVLCRREHLDDEVLIRSDERQRHGYSRHRIALGELILIRA